MLSCFDLETTFSLSPLHLPHPSRVRPTGSSDNITSVLKHILTLEGLRGLSGLQIENQLNVSIYLPLV